MLNFYGRDRLWILSKIVCVWATDTVYIVDSGDGICIWWRDFIIVHRSTVPHTEVWFLFNRGL